MTRLPKGYLDMDCEMKMKPADFDALRDAIEDAFPHGGRDYAHWRWCYRVVGHSDERFRWDCLHLSDFNTRPLYLYLTDSHIDTALRRIIGSLDSAA